jgi:predicted  nucleic acid-binding Zn-ribbon protein
LSAKFLIADLQDKLEKGKLSPNGDDDDDDFSRSSYDSSKDRQLEDLLVSNEQLQLKLTTKTKIVNDLTKELTKEKTKLEQALCEINRLKLIEVDHSVHQKIHQIDSDGEIEFLRSRVMDLEQVLTEFQMKHELLTNTLAADEEKLQSVHHMLGEISISQDLKSQRRRQQQQDLEELQRAKLVWEQEKKRLEESLGLANNSLQLANDKNKELQEVIDSLNDALLDNEVQNINSSETKVVELQNRIKALELDILNMNYDRVQEVEETEREITDLRSTVTDFQQQITELTIQKNHLAGLVNAERDGTIQLQQALMDREQDQQDNESDLLQEVKDLRDTVFILEKEKCDLDDLLTECTAEKVGLEQQVDSLIATIDELQNIKNNHSDAQCEVDSSALIRAETEIRRLVAKSQHIEEENSCLRQSSVSVEAFAEIKNKLSDAVRKADFLSADRAKAFALSSRVVAYLESECIRFQSLVDHYRSSNAKLSADMRGLQLKVSLAAEGEHKLHLAQQNEELLSNNVAILEDELRHQAKELLDLNCRFRDVQQQFQLAESTQQSVTNAGLDELLTAKRQLEDECRLLRSQLTSFEHRRVATQEDHDREINSLEHRLRSKQAEIANQEVETNALKLRVSEQELMLKEFSLQRGLLEEQLSATKALADRNSSDLKEECAQQMDTISLLRSEVDILKKHLVSTESQALQSSEQFSKNLLQFSEGFTENRAIRNKLDDTSVELSRVKEELRLTQQKVSVGEKGIIQLEKELATSHERIADQGTLIQQRDVELRCVCFVLFMIWSVLCLIGFVFFGCYQQKCETAVRICFEIVP